MTKNKKIVIGILSLLLLLVLIYIIYHIYNKKNFITSYSYEKKCRQNDISESAYKHCASEFQNKCKSTNGKVEKSTFCRSTVGDMMVEECYENDVKCKCPVLQIWDEQDGCGSLWNF